MKTCAKCKQTKNLEEFYYQKLIDTYKSQCKECSFIYFRTYQLKKKIESIEPEKRKKLCSECFRKRTPENFPTRKNGKAGRYCIPCEEKRKDKRRIEKMFKERAVRVRKAA